MMQIYSRFEKLRDQFEIVALHDTRVRDFQQLDRELARRGMREKWKGDLPFPVFLDATGATLRQWGVPAVPFEILIDPEGRVVPGGAFILEERLEAIAAKKGIEIPAAEPPPWLGGNSTREGGGGQRPPGEMPPERRGGESGDSRQGPRSGERQPAGEGQKPAGGEKPAEGK